MKTKKVKPQKILVVDDEREICKMLLKCLSSEGHKVKSAFQGDRALQLVGKEHFDIVFLDVIMPGTPSLFVLREIKRVSQKTKVIMMTGRMLDQEFKKELRDRGSYAFIQKPFTLEEIRNLAAGLAE